MLNFKKEEIKEKVYFTSNIGSFFIVLIFLLLAWLPFFLEYFPGTLTFDSIIEIYQILGEQKLTNYNPIIHVGFLAFSLAIGNLFGSISAGVAVNTILQFIIVASICSFSIYYLAKKKVDIRIRISCLIIYSFLPTIPIMNVIIHKDTIFSAFMILLIIVYYELISNFKNLFKHKLRIIFGIIIIVITSLSRRNALYVLYATVLFFSLYVFVNKNYFKGYVIKIICFLLISLVLAYSSNRIVLNYTKVEDSWKKYIPAQYNFMVQQLLRIAIDHKEEMKNDELKLVNGLFGNTKKTSIENCYTPYLVDTAMQEGDSVFFKKHKSELVNLYFRLILKYPISFIDSVFCTTSGYWDIEETRFSLWTNMRPNNFGVETNPILENYYAKFMYNLMYYQNIPLIGLLYSASLPFWIILGLIVFNLYNKKIDIIIVFIPLILYFGTMFVGPLNGENRYVFCFWMCLPLLIALTLHKMGTNE